MSSQRINERLPFEAFNPVDISDNDSTGIELYLASIATILSACLTRLDMNFAASIPPWLSLQQGQKNKYLLYTYIQHMKRRKDTVNDFI